MANAPRILIHNDETTALAQALHGRFPQAEVAECTSYEALPAQIAGFRPEIVYSVRFAGTTGFPRDALLGAEGPRWIAIGGAGTDHLGTWDTARTTITNAAGVAADMMAEYVMGGFLHFTLDVDGLQADQRDRLWRARKMRPLRGATLLIVGLGHTGRAIAARAKAFGMHVIGTRATPQPMDNVDAVHAATDLPGLLPLADFVAVATPLTPATKGLIGVAEVAALKPGAVLADVSRGTVVDQGALAGALASGRLTGAVLDVFEVEPLPQKSPLWGLDNVLISPHCSSVYDGWESASFELFLDNLARWLDGKALFNVVDPARGY
ncbi:D-2-hydroxyacid dehydrogenase [Gymnodinialimonas sp.]